MYGDVNVNIKDGQLGISSDTGTGVHFKIGISSIESSVPILIKGSMNAEKIKEKLGLSPLADACIDSVENGANTIYCIPVKATADGAIEIVEKNVTGTGTIIFEGKPNNTYDIILKIIESGASNVATMQISIDDGYSFGEEIVVPISKEYEIEGTGVIIKFSEDMENSLNSFCEGDSYSVRTTGPSVSNEKILEAVETLKNSTIQFEFVHIVGASEKGLWAALSVYADSFLDTYKKPLFFVCEARIKEKDETLDAYLDSMKNEKKNINNYFIQVVLSNSYYLRSDGREQEINNAGIVCGLYSLAKESQSIGEVRSFAISEDKMIRLLPEGIDDYIKEFDDANYLTFRKYVGLEGYYVTSAKMMAPENSDYRYAEDIRVINRLVKEVRKQALQSLQLEVDADEGLESDLAAIEEELRIPIEQAVDDKIISSGNVSINVENINILVDESIDIDVTYVPKGHLREINISFAMENPNRI